MRKGKNLALFAMICAFLFMSLFMTAMADDHNSHSIVGDWFNKVFDVELTDGTMLLDTDETRAERERINDEILGGTTNVYSLYDRFGGDIAFVPYFGETRIETGIFDRFYNKIVTNDDDFGLSLADIKLFFEQSAVSNNVVYTGRMNILSSEEIDSGYKDPRVFAYSAVSTTGGDAALGNLMLGVSKAAVSVTSFVTGSGLFTLVSDVFEGVINLGLGALLEAVSAVVLPIIVLIFVIGLVRYAFQYLRGDQSLRTLLTTLLSGMLSLGIIFSFVAAPLALNVVFKNVVLLIDTVLDDAMMVNADEVVASCNTDNVREATLWRSAVFEPWCVGTFGDTYDHLYTQYAAYEGLPAGKTAMSQSDEDVISAWDDGTVKYNSVKITGDVTVPLGGVKEVKNWAALAWSCQSLYHIDATELDYVVLGNQSWPKAETCPSNEQIYVDNFRWLDAMLNISPEYRAPDSVRMNFSESELYAQSFVRAGGKSLFMALMLIPIFLLGLRKMMISVKLVGNGFTLLYQCVMNFISPDSYNIITAIKRIGAQLFDYLWWSISIFISIILYTNMVGKGIIASALFIIMIVYIMFTKPIRTSSQVRRAVNTVKRTAGNAKRWVQDRFKKAGSHS